jgi:hypothetical protein
MDDNKDIQHGFLRPRDHNDDFARRMSAKLECLEEIREFKMLSALKGIRVFVIPEGYFVQKMELESLVFLPNKTEENKFLVPDGYFEKGAGTLTDNERRPLAEKLDISVTEDIIPAGKIRSLRQPLIWIAAALLLVALGTWLNQIYTVTPVQEDCGTLACLEKRDVLKSGELDVLNEEELLLLLNDEDLKGGMEDENADIDSISNSKIKNKDKEGA